MQIYSDNDAKSVDEFWEEVNGINSLEFLSFKQVLIWNLHKVFGIDLENSFCIPIHKLEW